MKHMSIIYVVETVYEGRVITVGASLSEEAVEKRIAELKKVAPQQDFWSDTYCITDEYKSFDWI